MIPALIGQMALPVLTGVLAQALGAIDNPVTKGAAKALEAVDAAIKGGQIDAEQIAEANRHAEKMAELELSERGSSIAQINQSLRAEIASEDIYVRRMRPTFGYIMAVSWGAQMLG